MMRILKIAPFLLLSLIAVAACQTTKDAANLANMSVAFNFQAKHGCSSVSPEFNIGNVPSGAKFLKFRMTDLDYTSFNHGGGTVAYNGSGKISEGALTSYNGPCPPVEHRYEMVVEALNADQTMVLGRGKSVENFCCR